MNMYGKHIIVIFLLFNFVLVIGHLSGPKFYKPLGLL